MSIKASPGLNPEKYSAKWLLFCAICAVSTASIFIRYAQKDLSSLTIAWGRMLISALILLPWLGKKAFHDFFYMSKKSQFLVLLSGTLLGLHFIFWITSLEKISIAASVILVTTTPLWVAIFSPTLLNEKPGKIFLIALAISFIGIIIITLTGAEIGNSQMVARHPSSLFGYFLALLGAWCAGGYSLIGRKVRETIALRSYIFIVYASASILLTFIKIAFEGFAISPSSSWIWLVFLAIFPQIIGHSFFNFSLRKIQASTAALALLGEPVGSIILGFIFLGEVPATGEIFGGLLILAGLILGSSKKK